MSELSISNLVNVQVDLSNAPAQSQSLQNLLVVGNSNSITYEDGIKRYSSLSEIAFDFASDTHEYKAAQVWFAQRPQPKELLVANSHSASATSARLVGSALTKQQTVLTSWKTITAGYFTVTIDGQTFDINGLNFSNITSLTDVASIITLAIQANDNGHVMSWNATTRKFTLTSGTTGATSTMTKLTNTVGGVGTGIANRLLMNEGAISEVLSQGLDAITVLNSIIDLEDRFGQTWYALFVPFANDEDHIDIAKFIEASTNKHAYCVNTSDIDILTSENTTNISYLLKELGLKKTLVQYSSKSDYAVVSLVGRILTTDYTANKSVITLMYKDEPTIISESLSQTQMDNLLSYNCNVFVKYNNQTSIIQPGIVSSGEYIDNIFGADWLAVTIQTSVYNLLYTSKTKIPQTNDGNNVIKAAIVSVLNQGVVNGLLAKGLVWNQAGVGDVSQGDILTNGYYVYVPDINSQSPEDRAARKAVTIQVLAQLSGAIQSVDVLVSMSR